MKALSKPKLPGGVSHPARFHDAILERCAVLLEQHCTSGRTVLDPFGGTGRVTELAAKGWHPIGVELEPEWARLARPTINANSTHLPIRSGSVDAIVTSPCYGNRMADSYDAIDPEARRSYRFDLGRKLHPSNTGAMQWGEKYRTAHRGIWRETVAVLKPNGVFLLNVKDHYRKDERQYVAGWHVSTLCRLGMTLQFHTRVITSTLNAGENADARRSEQIYVLRKDGQ